jgi:hypothetical protein
MIHDSAPWKTALARDADLIERWAAKPALSERRSFLIERKTFLAAFALRKLDEASKLSSATLTEPVKVTRHPPKKAGYAAANNQRWDEFFDLQAPIPASYPGRRLVNIIIHSLIFVEALTDDFRIEGFMVTSDQESERGLLQVELPDFLGLMRRAADDFPSSMRRQFHPTTGKWKVWAGHGGSPVVVVPGVGHGRFSRVTKPRTLQTFAEDL